tara:strand:+ start:358 stop:564 length:207 start_codon:yes stop_codon:yes gene_type:complete
METLIIGLVFNIWTWNNADFFVQRKNNERMYECRWVDVGWQETDYKNPSINIFGQIRYKQKCVTKEEK